mmetsp:Transcript_9234/g.27188  ORF Transcript_9234/g.27188 Transcript_9234/m.27188 type:complete len:284 (-) Transcript_9234:87-938(-)
MHTPPSDAAAGLLCYTSSPSPAITTRALRKVAHANRRLLGASRCCPHSPRGGRRGGGSRRRRLSAHLAGLARGPRGRWHGGLALLGRCGRRGGRGGATAAEDRRRRGGGGRGGGGGCCWRGALGNGALRPRQRHIGGARLGLATGRAEALLALVRSRSGFAAPGRCACSGRSGRASGTRSRRLAAASATGGGDALRWRALYVSRACPACLDAPGDFAARRSKHEAPLYLLCGACCRRESVIDKMRAAGATLDVTGVSGKPLYTQRGDRFVSEVAAAARRAGLG